METLEQKRIEIRDELSIQRERAKKSNSFIIDRLNLKQLEKWYDRHTGRHDKLHFVTKNKKILMAAVDYIAAWRKIEELRQQYDVIIKQIDSREQLRLAVSSPYSWYERTVQKLNAQAGLKNKKHSKKHLSLVG